MSRSSTWRSARASARKAFPMPTHDAARDTRCGELFSDRLIDARAELLSAASRWPDCPMLSPDCPPNTGLSVLCSSLVPDDTTRRNGMLSIGSSSAPRRATPMQASSVFAVNADCSHRLLPSREFH
eukprot:3055766-Prymnesium_polylepis.1